MPNYIDSDFPLIKLHGSIDWVQWVDVGGGPHGDLQPKDLIVRAESLHPKGPVEMMGKRSSVDTGDRLFDIPALALPVVTKSQFMCPQSHLDRLIGFLPKVEKILVVGWRGSEKHFLRLLSEGLQNPVRVLSVCGRQEDSNQTNQRIKDAGVEGEFLAAAGGFSNLLSSGEGEEFLRS